MSPPPTVSAVADFLARPRLSQGLLEVRISHPDGYSVIAANGKSMAPETQTSVAGDAECSSTDSVWNFATGHQPFPDRRSARDRTSSGAQQSYLRGNTHACFLHVYDFASSMTGNAYVSWGEAAS